MCHVFIADLQWIHAKFVCQPVYHGFHCKNSLCCPITAVSACWHMVRVYNIIPETKCFRLVHRDGFMSTQTYSCRSMLSESTCIRQSIQVQRTDRTIFHCTQFHGHFHLMPRRWCDHGFLSGKNHFGRFSGFHRHNCRIYLGYHGLFCSKTSSDSRLYDADFWFWNIERIRQNPSHMKRDLCRR